ncbi:amino acid adenylation domain-containing protein [Sphingomonas flavalba]|uniref:amino acid adenylation domain-containing protein n=1 Tax=Sphingomonas flavalba TaxID=2559804 RepID=UPI0039E09D6F
MIEADCAVPLTEAQLGLWYAQRLDPNNPIFNTGQYIDLRGPMDVDDFRAAFDQAIGEAEALSLRIVEGAGGPVQYHDPALYPQMQWNDLSGDASPERSALAAIQRDMDVAVDPAVGPLAGSSLYRLSADRHLWALRIHHLANDGYAMVLLTSRVAEIYAALRTRKDGRGRPLAPLAGVLAEDAAYRSSDQRAADAAWWRGALQGMADIVGMAPGRAVSAARFHRFERGLPDDVRAGLIRLAKGAGLGWPDVLTALVAGYCRRFTGTEEIVVGVPHMGRMGSASARVPAMVMNVLPLRLTPDDAAPIGDYLAAVAAATAEARRHGRYRSEQMRRDLGLIGGHRRIYGPLINVQPYDRPPRFHGLEAVLHVTGTGPVEDISFTFRGDGLTGLSIEVDANPELYDAQDVVAHGERLALFLAGALEAATLGEVPTATPDEIRRELTACHGQTHPLPPATLAELIERAMVATPDAPALRFGDETLSYAELDRRTQQLAGILRARGVNEDSIVAVALPRSVELVVALVAVLRAGGAYLPLDLDHPAARIAAILTRARPLVVLAAGDPHSLYGDTLLAPEHWAGDLPDTLPLPQIDNAAYVIFTSGSTGEPKGVVVTHRAIVNRLLWMREHYGTDASDRILQKTPATFDVSVWEFFLPLIAGATLVVAPPDAHRDPRAIAALIGREGITTLHFVPSMLAAFLDAPESLGLKVARVFCSGEELPADLRDRFHRRMQGGLHNLYGPTEAAVDVSYWDAGPGDTSRPVPIGHAVWNTRLLILDEWRRPVPPGMAGQLYLGGVQLARGYLGRPDLTAERFIDDPFHAGERLYLTGDLARRSADGAVVFLGRADHQVKLRGLRIELGEIEAAMAASGQTRGAVAIVRDDRIIAYVVPGEDFSAESLRAALTACLPGYMVPAAIVALDTLPVTGNGKLDRRALPAPTFIGTGGDMPATDSERRLAALYAELLSVSHVGAKDDFFALGGDSLKAVQLMLRVSEIWGRDPGLSTLFEHPDVTSLAARIDAAGGDGGMGEDGVGDRGLGPLITLAGGDAALPPLFVVHPAGGLCWGYRTLARALSPARAVHGLQSPALAPDRPLPDSIDALAADYARRMIAVQPEGPWHVMGWSVGGIIAQAVAVHMADAGREMGLVAMLDSYPAECWRAEPEPTQIQALRALLAIAGYDPESYPHLTSRDQILAFLRDGDSALGNLPPDALDGVVRVVLDTNRLVRGHHHRWYPGRLTHVRAGADHGERPQLMPSLWTPYAGTLDLVSVPFLHPQLTGAEASALIAPLLSERMNAKGLVWA